MKLGAVVEVRLTLVLSLSFCAVRVISLLYCVSLYNKWEEPSENEKWREKKKNDWSLRLAVCRHDVFSLCQFLSCFSSCSASFILGREGCIRTHTRQSPLLSYCYSSRGVCCVIILFLFLIAPKGTSDSETHRVKAVICMHKMRNTLCRHHMILTEESKRHINALKLLLSNPAILCSLKKSLRFLLASIRAAVSTVCSIYCMQYLLYAVSTVCMLFYVKIKISIKISCLSGSENHVRS
jgi:hypothetical protein